MLRQLAEWTWRLAMLAAVLWVGWEVVQLREDILDIADPGDEATAATASPTHQAPGAAVPTKATLGIQS